MSVSKRRFSPSSGMTIVEVVCAMVIFFVGCLFLFKMFHLAIWSSGTLSDDAMATIIAKKKMESIRAWCSQPSGSSDNFSSSGWSSLNGTVETDPEYPRFTIRAYNTPQPLACPASVVQPNRMLTASARAVKVEVAWKVGNSEKKFNLVTIVGEPRRELFRVAVLPGGDITLGPLESQTFTAEAYDKAGNQINDLVYKWYPRPETATGTLSGNIGPSVDFSNYLMRKGNEVAQEGDCKITSGTKSGGIEMYGYSGLITLYTGTP